MYSIYNRSIPISFQNALYCGTESRQSNAEQAVTVPQHHSNFFTALILLLLFTSFYS